MEYDDTLEDGQWPPVSPTDEEVGKAQQALYEAVHSYLAGVLTTKPEKRFLKILRAEDIQGRISCIPQLDTPATLHLFARQGVTRTYRGIGFSQHAQEFRFDPSQALSLVQSIKPAARQTLAQEWVHEELRQRTPRGAHESGTLCGCDSLTAYFHKRLRALYQKILQSEQA